MKVLLGFGLMILLSCAGPMLASSQANEPDLFDLIIERVKVTQDTPQLSKLTGAFEILIFPSGGPEKVDRIPVSALHVDCPTDRHNDVVLRDTSIPLIRPWKQLDYRVGAKMSGYTQPSFQIRFDDGAEGQGIIVGPGAKHHPFAAHGGEAIYQKNLKLPVVRGGEEPVTLELQLTTQKGDRAVVATVAITGKIRAR